MKAGRSFRRLAGALRERVWRVRRRIPVLASRDSFRLAAVFEAAIGMCCRVRWAGFVAFAGRSGFCL